MSNIADDVSSDIHSQCDRVPYPKMYSAILLGVNNYRPTLVPIPADYGTTEPFAPSDLCVHFWLDGGIPAVPTSRRVDYSAAVATTDSEGFPLRNAFTMFFNKTTSGDINDVVFRMSCGSVTWFGNVIVVVHDDVTCTTVTDATLEDIMYLGAAAVRVMESGRVRQYKA